MEVDLTILGYYDPLLNDLEAHIVKAAKQHDANTLYLLQLEKNTAQAKR